MAAGEGIQRRRRLYNRHESTVQSVEGEKGQEKEKYRLNDELCFVNLSIVSLQPAFILRVIFTVEITVSSLNLFVLLSI